MTDSLVPREVLVPQSPSWRCMLCGKWSTIYVCSNHQTYRNVTCHEFSSYLTFLYFFIILAGRDGGIARFFFVTGTLAQVCTWPPGVLRPSWRRTWQWQRDIVKQWSRRDTKQWLQSSLKLDVLRPPSNLSSWNMLIVAVQKMKRRVRKWARKLLSRNATRIMLWTWQDLVKTQIKCQRIWHQSWFRFS